MSTHYPITVYYDASCRLCNGEMQNLKVHDVENKLQLIDCSALEFDEAVFKAQGITREHMMNRMHAHDAEGHWFIGVAAFEVIYQAVGLAFIAALWGGPITKPVAERLYPWVVSHRYLLSKIGLPELFGYFQQRAARKAELSSRLCRDGHCAIDKE